MKKIGSLLDKRKLARRINIDQQTIFYIFDLVIKEEYGKQGAENIKTVFLKDKKIFIKFLKPNWESEIKLQKKYILKKINDQLGENEIMDLLIA